MEDLFEMQPDEQDTPEPMSDELEGTSEEGEAAEGYPQDEALEDEEQTQDNWEVRARYFQSQYDKLRTELEAAEQQRTEIDPWRPLINKLQENPTALKTVAEILEGKQEPQEPELRPPDLPQKPATYSHYEAMNDPESESAKYEQGVIEYNAQFAEYTREMEQRRAIEEQQQRAAQMAQAQQQTYLRDVYNTVQAQYGLRPQEAAEFIRTMTSPDSIDIKNLVGYYKYMKAMKGRTGKPPLPPQHPTQTPPPPGGVGGSSSGEAPDVSESFIRDMKSRGRSLFETF